MSFRVRVSLSAKAIRGPVLVFGLFAASSLQADPIVFTGNIATDFAGIPLTETSVGYDPTAPEGNFSGPVAGTDAAPYNVFVGGDSTDFYVAIQTTSEANKVADFANLYLSTDPSLGTNIAFEVSNQNAFIPGGGNALYNTTPANTLPITFLVTDTDSTGQSTIEFGVPWSFFINDPLGLGFEKATPGTSVVQMRDSQSFGYTYTGGTSFGDNRFGSVLVPTPEPDGSVLALLGGVLASIFVGLRYVRDKRGASATPV